MTEILITIILNVWKLGHCNLFGAWNLVIGI